MSNQPKEYTMIKSLAFVLALALNSCAGLGVPAPQTPAEHVLAMKAGYRTALGLAVQYKTLPSCAQPVHPVVCSDAATVTKLRQVDDTAYPLVQAAQAAVDDPSADATTTAGKIALAQRALDALTAVTATLQVK